ncbi:DciA family protein [Rhodococcus sp. IEGM 1408]|uniref:DciA family protein n=1 Tax=Rhodococcus sp. IEGM 1408 TaxID=3082220 RepID=UPI0029556B38|nr:DciA family protein [Rhodococcus sp. IEGM 1408]MDV8000106.1 DciA family protein [Rhodococcus sp. IEGM 1408]
MSDQGRDPKTPSDKPQRGYDVARQALEEARTRARAEGKQVGRGRTGPVGAGKRLRKRGWTGSGADPWDPQPLGRLVGQVAKKRGWDDKVTTGRLFAEWDRIVGEDVSAHATPERLEEGILYVRASSTAWATQLRLVAADILRKIAAAMGPGHVRRLKIEGPEKPSWRMGPLHVSGRGPRDTYG